MKQGTLIIFFLMSLVAPSLWAQIHVYDMEEVKRVLDPVAVVVVEDEVAKKEVKTSIYVVENILYINNAPENCKVEVKNMLGENVMVEKVTSSQMKINLDLKKGFYIVRVADALQRIVIK